MALAFVILFSVLWHQALSRRFAELDQDVMRISNEWTSSTTVADEQEDFPGVEFALYDSGGKLIASTSKKALPFSPGEARRGQRLYSGYSGNSLQVVGSTSWAETEAGVMQLGVVLAALWLPLTLLTAFASWLGGGLVLKPVSELVKSAERLSSSSIKQGKLETTDQAEFLTLAGSLNDLIGRVRGAAEVQEQFASDAAHELRSPLAILRIQIETTLLKRRSTHDYEAALSVMLSEVDSLSAIIETLLTSAQNGVTEAEPLELSATLTKFIVRWSSEKPWPASLLNFELQPCQAAISVDELAIVMRNLLDNAARHSPDDTCIEVKLVAEDKSARISVRDFGSGISDEVANRAFDRFFRADQDRNRSHGGAGIGLSVVKRIVESRNGKVAFEPVETGAQVVVTLPLCP